MSDSNTSLPFYQRLAAHPLMPAERRQELLEHFFGLQLQMIDLLSQLMVPLYRYFARELENRNTETAETETDDGADASARMSRLRASQLKQIARMLMELRQAHERGDIQASKLYQSQFRELMQGFDYALISTLSSPLFVEPQQSFLLTREETASATRRLAELMSQADEDRNQLFTGNWRLVMEIARRFQTFGSKLDLDELIQEGNTGLLAAIDKFNPRMNLQLSTLAANWIQAKIRRALDNLSETIRTPVYKRQRKKLVQRAELELLLEAQKATSSTDDNSSQRLLTGAEKLFGRAVDDQSIATRTGLGIEEVQELRRLYPETVSIHAPVDGAGDSDESERGDFIADPAGEEQAADEQGDRKVFFELLTKLVDDLPLQHQVVLSGLNGLPLRKEVFKRLVHEKFDVLERRGVSLARGARIAGKASVQIFK